MTQPNIYMSRTQGLDGETLYVVGDHPRGLSGTAYRTCEEATRAYLAALRAALTAPEGGSNG